MTYATSLPDYDVDMEVHAEQHQSLISKAMKRWGEAMRVHPWMGFAFKAKPEAFASSCCAKR